AEYNACPMSLSAMPSSPSTRRWIANWPAAVWPCAPAVWSWPPRRSPPRDEWDLDHLHRWLSRPARPRTARGGRPGQARRPHPHPGRRGSHARPARAPHRYGCNRGTHSRPARPARASAGQGTGQYDDTHAVDITADLYSLGCTLYYLLTGSVPFPEGTYLQKWKRHQNEEPRPV